MGDSEDSKRFGRFSSESKDEWARSESERDRDRILYTREFRRLKDVTQVARAGESYLYHDRLTHSLKVAQVGRGLARLIRKRSRNDDLDMDTHLDPNVVEAACLAHDIGHPPFGHLSEEALDEILRAKTSFGKQDPNGGNELRAWVAHWNIGSPNFPIYGYEGNAQTFRIVTRTASHYKSPDGLNLSRATLNAILKYPYSRSENDEKWGYYGTEENTFEWARKGVSEGKTVEAQIMDYADDVTYAIHDMVDFYKGGLIPLDHLLGEAIHREEVRKRRKVAIRKKPEQNLDDIFDGDTNEYLPKKQELSEFKSYLENRDIKLEETSVEGFFRGLSRFPGVRDHLLTPFEGTDEERKTLSRLISNLVSRYLNAGDQEDPEFVYLDRDSAGNLSLHIDRRFLEQVQILKELTTYYVISNESLVGQQRGQRRVIEELFEALYEEAIREEKDDTNSSAIPEPYSERLRESDGWPSPVHRRSRIVADMIAAMTEPQAIMLHKRLTGDTPGSLQDSIVR